MLTEYSICPSISTHVAVIASDLWMETKCLFEAEMMRNSLRTCSLSVHMEPAWACLIAGSTATREAASAGSISRGQRGAESPPICTRRVCVCVCVCVWERERARARVHSVMWDSLWLLCPCDFSGKNTGAQLPFPTPGDLPDPGIEPTSLVSPALAGGFFTTAPPGKLTGAWARVKNQSFLLRSACTSGVVCCSGIIWSIKLCWIKAENSVQRRLF